MLSCIYSNNLSQNFFISKKFIFQNKKAESGEPMSEKPLDKNKAIADYKSARAKLQAAYNKFKTEKAQGKKIRPQVIDSFKKLLEEKIDPEAPVDKIMEDSKEMETALNLAEDDGRTLEEYKTDVEYINLLQKAKKRTDKVKGSLLQELDIYKHFVNDVYDISIDTAARLSNVKSLEEKASIKKEAIKELQGLIDVYDEVMKDRINSLANSEKQEADDNLEDALRNA